MNTDNEYKKVSYFQFCGAIAEALAEIERIHAAQFPPALVPVYVVNDETYSRLHPYTLKINRSLSPWEFSEVYNRLDEIGLFLSFDFKGELNLTDKF